jgi:hypothetical protein
MLQAAVARLEDGKTFDAVRLKPDTTYEQASDKVSRIFQVPTEQGFADSSASSQKTFRSN